MSKKAAFQIQLQGFPAANRDAKITLTNEVTGQTLERKPFLDGQLFVRDLEPGPYEMKVEHPNLMAPIDRRKIRLFPQPFPTRVPVTVRPELFRDTPIRDIPDADLAPVQQTAAASRDAVAPLATKAPGEVIRAADWNQLAGAVADLAGAVLELTNLVAPQGHDHPEIAEKIAEVQGNIRRFTEAFGRSLLELRRDIESQNLRRNVVDVLDQAGAASVVRERLLDRVAELEESVQLPTNAFTSKLAATGNVLLQEVNELAQAQGEEAEIFLARTEVRNVLQAATHFSQAGGQTSPEEELGTYQRTTASMPGSKFNFALR